MPARHVLIALVILNAIVLLGQIWPGGAPTFARVVNIGTLVANLVVFTMAIVRSRRNA